MLKVRVALVEDDDRLRAELAQLIDGASDMACVAASGTAEAALQSVPAARPDVVLMDFNLPGMSGVECTRQLKALQPEVQIVMLTSFEANDAIFESLKAGATGYILKRALGLQILEAVRDVRAGGSPMSSAIARKVVTFFGRSIEPVSSPEVDRLSDRERAVLVALAEGQQYKEVADQLGISINTVRNHVKHIYEKLHVNTRLEAVRKFNRV
jgi:DNA-binding NarL/FixJ family response regulator